MQSAILKMMVISFLNAAFACSAENSTASVKTHKLLTGGYIIIPSQEDIETIFAFLKEKELISVDPSETDKAIPTSFKVLSTALEWAQQKD